MAREERSPEEIEREHAIRENKFKEYQLDDWRQVLATPAGRAVMGHLLVFCRTLEANLETDRALISFREGLRTAGLYTMDHVRQAAPGKYLDILKEAEAVTRFFNTAPIERLNKARDIL